MDRERDRYPLLAKKSSSDLNSGSLGEVDDESKLLDDEPEVVIRTATNYFKDFVGTKGHSLHSVSQMPPVQLSEYLKDFYSNVKSLESTEPIYCSLKYIRTGLQRYFQKSVGIDIVNDHEFANANGVFDVALKQAPTRRCHRLRIDFDDLKKLYLGPGLETNQPDTLQNKVFFDINLYICNRGKDFLRVMSKSDFEVASDTDGRRYVWLKNSAKFSFKELVGGIGDGDTSSYGGQIGDRMYERQGTYMCRS